MSDEVSNADNAAKAKTRTGIKVLAIVISVIPFFLGPVLRHLHHSAHASWAYAFEILILGPIALVCVIAMIRPQRPQDPNAKAPPKTLLWYSLQNEKWRNSLIMLILMAGLFIGGLLLACVFFLAHVSPPFFKLLLWMMTPIGVLAIVTVSLAVTFLSAALLGPRLIKITTGRMPLGVPRRRRNAMADRV